VSCECTSTILSPRSPHQPPRALNAASANRSPGVGGAACAGTRERSAAATGGHDERGRDAMFTCRDGSLHTATALAAEGLLQIRRSRPCVPHDRLRFGETYAHERHLQHASGTQGIHFTVTICSSRTNIVSLNMEYTLTPKTAPLAPSGAAVVAPERELKKSEHPFPPLEAFTFSLYGSKSGWYGPGGSAVEQNVSNFPMSTSFASVSMKLDPGAMRELHWHAIAAEWAYVLTGHMRTTVITPKGAAQ
jgi:Cupin